MSETYVFQDHARGCLSIRYELIAWRFDFGDVEAISGAEAINARNLRMLQMDIKYS